MSSVIAPRLASECGARWKQAHAKAVAECAELTTGTFFSNPTDVGSLLAETTALMQRFHTTSQTLSEIAKIPIDGGGGGGAQKQLIELAQRIVWTWEIHVSYAKVNRIIYDLIVTIV